MTDIVSKFGMEIAIKGVAGIMTVGCLMRSGILDLVWLDKFGFDLGMGVANADDTTGDRAFGLGAEIANAAHHLYSLQRQRSAGRGHFPQLYCTNFVPQ